MTIKNKKIFKKRLKNAHELCIIILLSKYGEMAERSKAAVLKTSSYLLVLNFKIVAQNLSKAM